MRIPPDLLRDARLFSCCEDDTDAVCFILRDYGNQLQLVRQARRDLSGLAIDQQGFEHQLAQLQKACRAILEL